MSRPILIYGATGFTGRCCVRAAESRGVPYLVGGRNRAGLEAAAGPGCVGVRVADAADPGDAFEGVGCVISTVGPFFRYGLPVLDAAIAAGAHYVDSTAEQSFLKLALTRHDAAKSAGITALPSSGVEYAPMFLAAAMLGEGPVDTYLWLDDFLPTRGSVRSMIAMAGVGPTPRPFVVTFEERRGAAIQIPGAEEILIHPNSRTYLMLRRREALPFAAVWPIARWFPPSDALADWVASQVTDPTDEQCAQARFTAVVVRGDQAMRIDGRDVYGSTGRFCVSLAELLVDGHAESAGVLATGAALDPASTLSHLGLSARRLDGFA